LLPYIEQEDGYRTWDLARRYYEQSSTARQVRTPAFYCPSRRPPGPFSRPAADARPLLPSYPHTPGELSDYAVCGGSGLGDNDKVDTKGAFIRANATWSHPREDPNCRVTSWRAQLTHASVSDGLSNTLLLGDKHVRPGRFYTTLEDSCVFNGDHTYGFVRYAGRQADTGTARPLARRDDSGRTAQRFGSWHPGVCNFAFADGSVRAVGNAIDLGTLTRLADRADGLPVGDY
ncbi:MAG: DUF1559 domain-containing protein, partial [Gemmataceae bacterium]